MNKKGFSLIELLTVFILLGIVAGIVYSLTDSLKEDSRIEVLRTSAKKLFTIAENYNADNDYKGFPVQGVLISELDIETTSFISGRVRLNKNGEYTLYNVSDGTYCINGTLENLVFEKDICQDELPSPIDEAVMAYVILNPTNLSLGKTLPSIYSLSGMTINTYVIYVDKNDIIVSVNSGYASTNIDDSDVIDFRNSLIVAYSNSGVTNASEIIHYYISMGNELSYVVAEECKIDSTDYCSGNKTITAFYEQIGTSEEKLSQNIIEIIF